jgi:hypothetical protein
MATVIVKRSKTDPERFSILTNLVVGPDGWNAPPGATLPPGAYYLRGDVANPEMSAAVFGTADGAAGVGQDGAAAPSYSFTGGAGGGSDVGAGGDGGGFVFAAGPGGKGATADGKAGELLFGPGDGISFVRIGSDGVFTVAYADANFTGNVTAAAYYGDGSHLTNLPIPDLTGYVKLSAANVFTAGQTINIPDKNSSGIVVKAAAGQIAPLLSYRHNDNTELFAFDGQLGSSLLRINLPNDGTGGPSGFRLDNGGAPRWSFYTSGASAYTFFCQYYGGGNGFGITAEGLFTLVGLGLSLPHIADAAAKNDTVYYSTTAGRLVYKDAGGVVNNLY